jgi:hypothetical protein
MATPSKTAQKISNVPFTRMTHPDPITNMIVQDIYDKLAQVLQQVNQKQSS